jgi:hypothetical protein
MLDTSKVTEHKMLITEEKNHIIYITNNRSKVPSEYVPVKKRNSITERVRKHKQQKITKVNRRIKKQLHRLSVNDSQDITLELHGADTVHKYEPFKCTTQQVKKCPNSVTLLVRSICQLPSS